MDRLRGIASFLVIAAVAFAALRLLHLAVPVFYPKVLVGPVRLDRIEAVARYTGFSPRLPFYRPQQLGARPVDITVSRRPHPKVVIVWQGERFLYLAQQQGGERPPSEGDAVALPGRPDSSWSREGGTHHVVVKLDDLWIELRTDLPSRDLRRLVDTLRPYRELL